MAPRPQVMGSGRPVPSGCQVSPASSDSKRPLSAWLVKVVAYTATSRAGFLGSWAKSVISPDSTLVKWPPASAER
jgi:hypothetical protein